MRIVAFKATAVNLHGKMDNEKFYKILKVSVRQNVYNSITELKIVLDSDIHVEETAGSSPTEIPYIPLVSLKNQQEEANVHVTGRILRSRESEKY